MAIKMLGERQWMTSW